MRSSGRTNLELPVAQKTCSSVIFKLYCFRFSYTITRKCARRSQLQGLKSYGNIRNSRFCKCPQTLSSFIFVQVLARLGCFPDFFEFGTSIPATSSHSCCISAVVASWEAHEPIWKLDIQDYSIYPITKENLEFLPLPLPPPIPLRWKDRANFERKLKLFSTKVYLRFLIFRETGGGKGKYFGGKRPPPGGGD